MISIRGKRYPRNVAVAITIGDLLVAIAFGLSPSCSNSQELERGSPSCAAVAATRAGVQRGDPASIYRMARYYSTGKCVPGDGQQALALYQRAADLAYPPAFFNIGIIDAAAQDYQGAETAFLKGATLGHRGCELMLGILYSQNEGVGDDAKAVAWLKLTLSRHDPASADAARAVLATVEARLSPTDRRKADANLIEIKRQYGPIPAFRR